MTTNDKPQLHNGAASSRIKHSPALEELEARWARYTKEHVSRLLKDFDNSQAESLKYYGEREASIRFRLTRLVKRHENKRYRWSRDTYQLEIQEARAKAQKFIQKNSYLVV